MNALTVGWLVFLALIKYFSCAKPVLFTLDDRKLTAKEGSCIEIKCRVTHNVDDAGAYWFWIKNAIWNNSNENYTGTIVYSTNDAVRPVSPDFEDRVKYIGSPSSSWKSYAYSPKLCSILICKLKKTDSGDYSFRFLGHDKWMTKPNVSLNVIENLCPITFEEPPVVNESSTITLTCSTFSSCPSDPQIGGLTQLSPTQLSSPQANGKQKSTTVSFTVNWQDDGKEFSCQTQDNKDKYLIGNVSVTVEYAPKQTWTEVSPKNIVEGQTVTLTCSSKGRPNLTFTWIKNEREAIRENGAVKVIQSIRESQSGEYYCEAQNKHGTLKSNPIFINVTYKPEVEVISVASVFAQGNNMTLTCNVKRSNPKPDIYRWFINETAIVQEQTNRYVVERIEPEDSGFYACSATNTAGTGTSEPLHIKVEYGPRKTNISISENYNLTSKSDGKVVVSVRVDDSLTFYCLTDANPAPLRYSWYRDKNDKQIDSLQWNSKTTDNNELRLHSVQRADEACYICNATNIISTGEDSKRVCIQVLYAPTEPKLSMDTEVREGQSITITCTVESFPPSTLTLTRAPTSNLQSPEWIPIQLIDGGPSNTLQHVLNVTSTDRGYYTCNAMNSEGSMKSKQRHLVVKYCPKDVTVQAQPALVVNENKSLTLNCSAQSHPPLTSVTWMKMKDGKIEIIGKTQTIILKSVSPSDRGQYSCEASNEIGTGNSLQAEVKVKYAPKHTKITRTAEQQLSDGTSFVTLSCSSDGYPLDKQYSWYKVKSEEGDEKVSDRQNYTVYSDQPGSYYCIAKNEIHQRRSDPVQLFERGFMKVLFIILFLIILLIFIIVLVYRHKRKKSTQQGTSNTPHCFGFLSCWNGTRRRNRMNEPGMAEPFRSRDDLLPDQPCRPKSQRRQPNPDSTPASNIDTVYCTVNLPSGEQGPSAQKPIRQQGGYKQDDSLNYASLHFENKQKNKQPKVEEDVYAMMSKQKLPKKNEERLVDYENVSTAHKAKAPNPLNYDSDTSEDEVELNYSQVSFKAKPGHQRAGRDLSSSDEENTQYSEVKI